MINKAMSQRGWMTLLALIMSISLYAQNTIKGVIVDETDFPLIGATVMVKGTSNGGVTDLDGKFTITAKKGDVLSVSYIGYKPQEIKIQDQKTLNIKMVPDNAMLDEVVVVGYGSMKRSDLTGSVSSVSAKNVEGFKTGSVMEALGGQVAGVQITQTDGTPGSGFDIKVRGIGTMTGDASPLYIVDGFQVDNINYLANSDIESIEVLKDASSAAIYGARAANGVVMVTTKSGKTGRPVVSYNGSTSYRKISKMLDLLDPYEFVKLQMEVNPSKYANTYYRTGEDDNGVPYRYQSMNDYIGVQGVDWQSETFRPTWSQDHNLSVMGGNDNTKYTLSFSRYNENGIFNNSGFDKTSGKFRVNQKVTKNVSFDATINYSNTNKKGAGTSGDSGRFNMLAQILSARTTGGLALTNEELLAAAIDPLELESSESLAQVNPIMQTQSVTNTKRSEMWSGNLSVTWEIIKGLTFKTAGTYNTTNTRTNIFYKNGSKEAYRNGQKPYGQTQMGRDLRWTNYNNLTWKQKIKKHSYDVMLGQEISFKSSEYLLGQAKDFPFDNMGNDNLGIGATPSKVATSYSDKTLVSFFARGNYSYNNRYLLTATVRADGSTVFSKKHKWGYFPSFSAAWRVSEENFMKNLEFISNAKVRFGWGTVGNDRISNYLSMDLYEQSKYGVGGSTVTVLTPKQLKNENLKWERTRELNIGIDSRWWGGRLSFSAEYYNKKTTDLLMWQKVPSVLGVSSILTNVGSVSNKGFDIMLGGIPVSTKHFKWDINYTLNINKNKILELDGLSNTLITTGADYPGLVGSYVQMVGQLMGTFLGYTFAGVWQKSEVSTAALYGAKPGDAKYVDINRDGKIDKDDIGIIGNAQPKLSFGFNNTFTIFDFDLNIFCQGVSGNDIYNQNRIRRETYSSDAFPTSTVMKNHWTPENPTNIPAFSGAEYVNSSRWVEKGDYLRLKNITLGYRIPHKILSKIGCSSARIYVSANNLWTITNYSGFDPEASMGADSDAAGVDRGVYPSSKSFLVGLDISF